MQMQMPPVKTHTFNGRVYKIVIDGPMDGQCTQYKPEYEIWIMAPLEERKGLITAIHEALHACDWRANEARVDQISTEIGSFLWRLGYRRENVRLKRRKPTKKPRRFDVGGAHGPGG
jgi:hypothetical protein